MYILHNYAILFTFLLMSMTTNANIPLEVKHDVKITNQENDEEISSTTSSGEKNGCDMGGNSICISKGKHWICKEDSNETVKYRCQCDDEYKEVGGICIEKTGCEDLGGKDNCTSSGDHWVCKNDFSLPDKYQCECEEGFKINNGNCIEKTGCEDFGGEVYCKSKGKHWICKNDDVRLDKYRCECEKDYKIHYGVCTGKTGCEDLGGNSACRSKGKYWMCLNDHGDPKDYDCFCEEGYKFTQLYPGYINYCIEKNGCVDSGGNKVCGLKGYNWVCKNDNFNPGKYRCECKDGYKFHFGICTEKTGCEDLNGELNCTSRGNHWICKNDYTRPEKYACECEEGYKNHYGICMALPPCDSNPCPVSTECRPRGTNDYYCKCKEGYKLLPYTYEMTNKDKCIEMSGCEDMNGNYFCSLKGIHWICKNELSKKQKYRCECEENYKNEDGKCVG